MTVIPIMILILIMLSYLPLNMGKKLHRVVAALLTLGADVSAVNAVNAEGLSPLHLSGYTVQISPSTLTLLIDRGANCKLSDSRGLTPLHCVFLGDNKHCARLYADDTSDDISVDWFDSVERLLQGGANFSAQTHSTRSTPLHLACLNNVRPRSVLPKLLSNTNIFDHLKSALCSADILGNVVCHYIGCIEEKCECNSAGHQRIRNCSGLSTLMCNLEINPELPETDRMERTRLHKLFGDSTFDIFFAKGTWLQLLGNTDCLGRTALHHMCIVGADKRGLKTAFLYADTSILNEAFRSLWNVRDQFGRTALHYAYLYGKIHEFIGSLISAGADHSIRDNDGQPPETFAEALHAPLKGSWSAAEQRKRECAVEENQQASCTIVPLSYSKKSPRGELDTAYNEFIALTQWHSEKNNMNEEINKLACGEHQEES